MIHVIPQSRSTSYPIAIHVIPNATLVIPSLTLVIPSAARNLNTPQSQKYPLAPNNRPLSRSAGEG